MDRREDWQIFVCPGWLLWLPSQKTQNICITFVQRRPNVEDVGPTLYKCYADVCVCWAVLLLAVPDLMRLSVDQGLSLVGSDPCGWDTRACMDLDPDPCMRGISSASPYSPNLTVRHSHTNNTSHCNWFRSQIIFFHSPLVIAYLSQFSPTHNIRISFNTILLAGSNF